MCLVPVELSRLSPVYDYLSLDGIFVLKVDWISLYVSSVVRIPEEE